MLDGIVMIKRRNLRAQKGLEPMQNIPTELGAHMTLSSWDYDRQALTIDRNFSVVSRNAQSVVLRLDFPGGGIGNTFSPEFLRAAHRYFKSVGLA